MNAASGRVWRRGFAVVALALASGGAGWVLGQRGHEGLEPASADGATAHVATMSWASETRASAITDSFGEQAVLVEFIAEQGTTSGSGASCEPADESTDVLDVALLKRTLAEGTETDRRAALTAALQLESDVPPRLLQQTYVTDLSESVRLLAFKAYVDSISDDRSEVRSMLESGVYDMSEAVQAESRRRLAELERFEQMLAAAPPQSP